MASSSPLPSIPVELPFFPIEVWIKIWDFIDFHTLQKKCTIVSKSWFEVIRNTPTLSGEMELKKTIEKEDGTLETLNADGIDSILSHWPMLMVLYAPGYETKNIQSAILTKKVNLKAHTLLERIIAKPDSQFFKGMGKWGEAKKIWLNPKNIQAPLKLDGIISLAIGVGFKPAKLKSLGPKMKNLEELTVDTMEQWQKDSLPILEMDSDDSDGMNDLLGVPMGHDGDNPELDWISSFNNLKRLEILNGSFADVEFDNLKEVKGTKVLQLTRCNIYGNVAEFLMELPPAETLILKNCSFTCNISSLNDMLNSLKGMKNLQFVGECGFHLDNSLDQETTGVRMLEGMDTIEENGWKESLWIIDKKFGISGSRQSSSRYTPEMRFLNVAPSMFGWK